MRTAFFHVRRRKTNNNAFFRKYITAFIYRRSYTFRSFLYSQIPKSDNYSIRNPPDYLPYVLSPDLNEYICWFVENMYRPLLSIIRKYCQKHVIIVLICKYFFSSDSPLHDMIYCPRVPFSQRSCYITPLLFFRLNISLFTD